MEVGKVALYLLSLQNKFHDDIFLKNQFLVFGLLSFQLFVFTLQNGTTQQKDV